MLNYAKSDSTHHEIGKEKMTTGEKILEEVSKMPQRDKLVVVTLASALLQSQKESEKSKEQHKKEKKAA